MKKVLTSEYGPLILGMTLFFILVIIYINFWKKKEQSESSFDAGSVSSASSDDGLTSLPIFSELKFNLDLGGKNNGKDKVFPMVITKRTADVIELPFRLSLMDQNYPYKYVDIAQGESITIVGIKSFSYSINGNVLYDDFLVTDKDYLIAYTAAYNNFGIKK